MMIINRVSAAIVAGLSVLGMADPVWALGFGRPTSRAILGESLSVTVPVRLESGEELTEDCVATDVYFGDDKLSSSVVTTTLLPGSGSERTVRVSTTSLINEPVVTVYVAAGCKAKVSRKFVAFADPPGLMTLPSQAPDTVAAAPKASASPVSDSSVKATALLADPLGDDQALALAAPKEGRKARRERLAAERQAARASKMADAGDEASPLSQPAPSRGAVKSAAVAAAAPVKSRKAVASTTPKVSRELSAKVDAQPARSGARLELDPVEADAVVTPNLMMSAGMIGAASETDTPEVRERRAAAAALWAAMNASPEQLARDRQRLQELEARLQSLQLESAGANEKVAAMEARVRQAEQHSLRQPLVYGLAAACGLLLLAVGWLFMRQRRLSQTQDAWWQGDAAEEGVETAPTMAEPALARTSAEFMPVRTDAAPMSLKAPVAATESTLNHSAMRADAAPKADLASSMVTRPVSIKSESQEAVREITVEELIDLEQQAEFFVVLGQDDAALELLESHVQTTAGASPLPHLKLLEIYQRLGRRADYERVQAAFNGRFNAYAPSWESDLQQGHSLEEYPGVVERLQSLWSQPALAMDVLQVSLTRPDDSIATFDLPAYRELLFLYAVARDLSERDSRDRAPVDLVLPHTADGEAEADQLAPLMATRPVKAMPTATPSISLDLSLDEPAPSGYGAFVDDPITRHDNSIDFDLDAPPLPKR